MVGIEYLKLAFAKVGFSSLYLLLDNIEKRQVIFIIFCAVITYYAGRYLDAIGAYIFDLPDKIVNMAMIFLID